MWYISHWEWWSRKSEIQWTNIHPSCSYIFPETHPCHPYSWMGNKMKYVQGPTTGLTWKARGSRTPSWRSGACLAWAGIERGSGRADGKAWALSCPVVRSGANKRQKRPVGHSCRYLPSWGSKLRGWGRGVREGKLTWFQRPIFKVTFRGYLIVRESSGVSGSVSLTLIDPTNAINSACFCQFNI